MESTEMEVFEVKAWFLICLVILGSSVSEISGFPNDEEHLPTVFDFIIVGGGTAGCLLANRLTEDGKHSVLLLEAGGVPPAVMDIPGLAKENEINPDLTFQYQSVPQRYGGVGTNEGVHRIPLGRVLGGTSQINYMMFNRGSPYDFDHWANVTGDSSWRYENMLEHFKRSETYLGQYPSTDQHGFTGPIPVSYQEYAPGRNEWLNAGEELGFHIRDPNGPQEISFTPVEFSRRYGRRVSSYTGYLKGIMNSRRNLKVITNAYVTKLLLVGVTAVGVQYNSDGSFSSTSPYTKFAYCKREVILSSGTYGSASLLMRSGVGPRNVLRQARVPLIKELPVGLNLQDHPAVPMHFILNNKSLSLDPESDYTPENFQLFQTFGQGPYTSAAGYGDGGQAYLSSSVASREGNSNWSDIQLAMVAVTTRWETYKNFSVDPWETVITMILYLGRQNSRGTVKLDPKNVDGMPIIDFNYLGDDDGIDMQILLEAIDLTLEIMEGTQTYRELGARFPLDPVRACSHIKFRTKEYWRCFIRQTLIPGNHPVGTCSMNSVVDSKLRVIGMSRLRVVDASVMPYITNTNLQAAINGIAEKAAEAILHDQYDR